MYFVDSEHELNYRRMLKQFEHSMSSEYHVACYVLAIPEIWQKYDGKTGAHPFDWSYEQEEETFEWTDDEGHIHVGVDRVYRRDENDKEIRSEAYIHLSSSYKLIVDAAQSLYNGRNDVNLGRCVNMWGEELQNVFLQAFEISIGRES